MLEALLVLDSTTGNCKLMSGVVLEHPTAIILQAYLLLYWFLALWQRYFTGSNLFAGFCGCKLHTVLFFML